MIDLGSRHERAGGHEFRLKFAVADLKGKVADDA
jgi:hypothetical protein